VSVLLVGDSLLLRLLHPRHERIRGLDDEEEDRRRRREKGDGRGDERAISEDGVVDGEGGIAEVWLPDDHGHDRHCEVVDERRDDGREREATTNATASSTRLPRTRKSRNSSTVKVPAVPSRRIPACSARS
jgi:hypothetical protein